MRINIKNNEYLNVVCKYNKAETDREVSGFMLFVTFQTKETNDGYDIYRTECYNNKSFNYMLVTSKRYNNKTETKINNFIETNINDILNLYNIGNYTGIINFIKGGFKNEHIKK